MNPLQTILEQFNVTPLNFKTGAEKRRVANFIKQAYLAGAEEHARLSDIELPPCSCDRTLGCVCGTHEVYLYRRDQKELSKKALQQIKELI